MNEQDSKPNVVSLSSRMAQPRFSELLQGCRQLLLNHLAKQLEAVFAGVDDALFECADKASSNSEQTLYFDSMREIRKQRVHLERAYHQWLGQKLSAFAEGRCQTAMSEQVGLDDLSHPHRHRAARATGATRTCRTGLRSLVTERVDWPGPPQGGGDNDHRHSLQRPGQLQKTAGEGTKHGQIQ